MARESAQQLRTALEDAVATNPTRLRLDFTEIEIVSPSFFDELLKVLEPQLTRDASPATLVLENSPIDLSNLAPVGATYGLRFERKGRDWSIERKLRRHKPLSR